MRILDEKEFNIALGKRLTLLRKSKSWSQEYLGALIGTKYQQVHKYETGENRVPPQKLEICAKIFNVPIAYFYGRDEEKLEKSTLTVASEMVDLPDSLLDGMYNLAKEINKVMKAKKITENKEHAA